MVNSHDDRSRPHAPHVIAPDQGQRWFGVVPALVLALGLEGCALFPLAALGGAALSASGSAITKGTQYTMTGSAQRTFTNPIDDVHRAVLDTFDRTGIRLKRDESSEKARRLVGEAEHRIVKISLTPLTPTLTSMQLVVKRNVLLKARATASELVTQTERALADRSGVVKPVCCDADCLGGRPSPAPRRADAVRSARSHRRLARAEGAPPLP